MPAPNEMSVSQLLRLIGTPSCPVIVDVCIEPDFAEDPFLIPGSIRHSHGDHAGLVARLAGQQAVVVCQKGLKLSQGVAAMLRSDGIAAEYLSGGMFGWRDHEMGMRIPASALPASVNGRLLCVTRHRPKIDRIACPWLIRRFVDRNAQFLFVAPDQVETVAEKFSATPFDVEGVAWSHVGDKCTFDVLLEKFGLTSEPLMRMARVIRAADTNRHELAPEAAGLLALSVGLSRQYRDDNEQLEAGMHFYDALYRWARDGHSEGHEWPGSAAR